MQLSLCISSKFLPTTNSLILVDMDELKSKVRLQRNMLKCSACEDSNSMFKQRTQTDSYTVDGTECAICAHNQICTQRGDFPQTTGFKLESSHYSVFKALSLRLPNALLCASLPTFRVSTDTAPIQSGYIPIQQLHLVHWSRWTRKCL